MTPWLGTILTRIFWLHLATIIAAAVGTAVAIYLLLTYVQRAALFAAELVLFPHRRARA